MASFVDYVHVADVANPLLQRVTDPVRHLVRLVHPEMSRQAQVQVHVQEPADVAGLDPFLYVPPRDFGRDLLDGGGILRIQGMVQEVGAGVEEDFTAQEEEVDRLENGDQRVQEIPAHLGAQDGDDGGQGRDLVVCL